MRIAFINPLSGYFKYDPMVMPPLGVLIIASKLRDKGHQILFIDRNSQYFADDASHSATPQKRIRSLDLDTRKKLADFAPDIVGITMMTSQMKDTQAVARLVRKTLAGDVIIAAGGYHPTCEPTSIFNDLPELDFAVRGQGEWAMLDVAAGRPWNEIPGLTINKNTQKSAARSGLFKLFERKQPLLTSNYSYNPDQPWSKDLIFTAPPARDLIDTSYYQRAGDTTIGCYYFRSPASIITSQGCPKRCSFCASKFMESKLYFQPVEEVVEEVERIIDTTDASALFFYDINFPVHKKRTKELCRRFVETGIADKLSWIACASADNLPYELLDDMRRAGCVGLMFGFESNSQRMLDILNKETPVELNQKAVDACINADIRPSSGFILGAPGETEDDINKSLEFIAKNDLLSSLNLLLPLPATPVNHQLKMMGKLDPTHPDYWGLISDTNAPMSPEKVYSDIPYDRFVEIYNNGIRDVVSKTWKTLYVDAPLEKPRDLAQHNAIHVIQ